MKILLQWFPQDIIDQYNIMDLVDKDCFVYVEIYKGMYGLKQAAHVAFDRLGKLLKPHGYNPLCSNPGIWCHETLPKKFVLCVDDFSIKCNNTAYDHHLVNTLQKYYKIFIDWEGKYY